MLAANFKAGLLKPLAPLSGAMTDDKLSPRSSVVWAKTLGAMRIRETLPWVRRPVESEG